MTKWITLAALFCAFLGYGLFLNRYNVQVVSGELRAHHPEGFFDYRGAVHVLSQRSSKDPVPVNELIAAQKVELDFIVFNDPGLRDSYSDGYLNGILVIEGSSLNYLDSLLLYLPADGPESFSTMGNPHVFLADLLSQNPQTPDMDLALLAHPFKPGFQWQGDYPTGLGGIEVINLRSIWQSSWLSSPLAFLWSVFVLPFNSDLALLRIYTEPEKELRLWDKLAQERRTLGVAGAHSKSSLIRLGPFSFTFPTYETSFGLISNHVLLESELIGDAERDRAQILRALQFGSVYMSLDILGNPKGFNAVLQQGRRTLPIGSRVSLGEGPLSLNVTLPETPRYPYEIVYWHNGQKIHNVSLPKSELPIDQPGVYRIQVRVIPTLPLPDGKKWTSWIFTNHFYVTP